MAQFVGWFFSTPLSQFTLGVVVVAGFLLGRPVARWLGWEVLGTRIALWGLGGALVPTYVSRVGYYDFHIDLAAVGVCLGGVTRNWAGPEELLNLILLAPYGVGLVLATRSFATPAALVAATAVLIEIGQSITGLGACERGDIVRNAAGGLVAAAIAWVFVVNQGSTTAPQRGSASSRS